MKLSIKFFMVLITFFIFHQKMNAQTGNPPVSPQSRDTNQPVYTIVEEQPVFQGSEKKYYKYLMDNIKYPSEAKKDSIQGTVFVEFIVETDGSITNVSLKKGTQKIGGGCDEEALRVIRSMPKWKPGIQSGKPVRVAMVIPIKFKLN